MESSESEKENIEERPQQEVSQIDTKNLHIENMEVAVEPSILFQYQTSRIRTFFSSYKRYDINRST